MEVWSQDQWFRYVGEVELKIDTSVVREYTAFLDSHYVACAKGRKRKGQKDQVLLTKATLADFRTECFEIIHATYLTRSY